MTRTALEHRPRFNLGRRFDSEFGSKHPGHKTPAYELSAIGYRLFAQRWLSVIRAALGGRVAAAMQRHRAIATFQKPGQDFRLGEPGKRGRLFLDCRCELMKQLAKRALFSPRTNERQIPR